jgi:hypothetical protein
MLLKRGSSSGATFPRIYAFDEATMVASMRATWSRIFYISRFRCRCGLERRPVRYRYHLKIEFIELNGSDCGLLLLKVLVEYAC